MDVWENVMGFEGVPSKPVMFWPAEETQMGLWERGSDFSAVGSAVLGSIEARHPPLSNAGGGNAHE